MDSVVLEHNLANITDEESLAVAIWAQGLTTTCATTRLTETPVVGVDASMIIDALWVDLKHPTLATPEVVVQTEPQPPAEYTRTLAELMGVHHLDAFWLAMHACARWAAPWLSICVDVDGVNHDLSIMFKHGVPTAEALAEQSASTHAVHAAGGALSLVMHEVRAAADQVDRLRIAAQLMAADAVRLTRRQRMYVLLRSQATAQLDPAHAHACAQLAELVYTSGRWAIREAMEHTHARLDTQLAVDNLLDDGPLDRVPTRTRVVQDVWTST